MGTIMVDKLNLKPGIWKDIESALKNHPDVRDVFHDRLFVDKNYYSKIFTDTDTYCKKTGVKFIGVDS